VVGAVPRLGNDTESLLRDLGVHNADAGVLKSVTPNDTATAPGSSSVMRPRVSGLYLPRFPSFPPPPSNWWRVGDEAESTCSWVATIERWLHDMLASVNQNILRLIRVSLKREENLARMPLASSMLSHPLLCFVSATLVLWQGRCACVAGKSDPGAGGSRRCGGFPCCGGTCHRDFCLGGCYSMGHHHSLCQGYGRSCHHGGEGGTGEGIECGGRECRDVSLCS
jgi:hypothetical protein